MPDHLPDDFKKKEAYYRYLKRKKNLALFVLSLFALLGMAVIIGLALVGGKFLNDYRDYKAGLVYKDAEPLKLTVVDNVYDGAFPELPIGRLPNNDPDDGDVSSPDDGVTVDPDVFHDDDESAETMYEPVNDDPLSDPATFSADEHVLGLIIIDAGHGGYDGGTSNSYGTEKDINLKIAYKLKARLEQLGFSVFMTREDDTYVGLYERARLANSKASPLALVSIHQNSVDDAETASGVEAWTYDRSGCRELAAALVRSVADSTGARNRGVGYRTNLVVTSKVTMPSAIIECGYMSNAYESYLLTTDEYLDRITEGIADGIISFADSYYEKK